MKKNELVLFERDCYTRADYELYCMDNEIEFDETNDTDFYNWLYNQEQWDFEDMLDNCKYSKKFRNIAVVVEGSVGLWYGRREIEQTKCDNFIDAIYKCMGRSCEIDKVVKIGNKIEVTAIHHDGRNYFDIYFLTELGADRLERRGQVSTRNRENVMKLPQYLWY